MVVVALLACTRPDPPPVDLLRAEPALSQSTNPLAPLGWELTLDSAGPVEVTVAVEDPLGHFAHGPFSADGPLAVWLHGWHAGETHAVVVTVADAAGHSTATSLEVVAPPAPADYPDVRLALSDPARMEPGVTLLAPNDEGPETPTYLTAFDAGGHIVWWYETTGSIHRIEQLPDGRIRYLRNQDEVEVIDLRGVVYEVYGSLAKPNALTVPTEAIHHDLLALPDGLALTLSVEARALDAYPVSESRTDRLAPALVVGDVIVTFDPATGAVAEEWRLLDLLDPQRVGWDSVRGGYWEASYGTDARDWSHANALQYDATADRIWVSLRHQDAIVAIGRASGLVEGILAPPEGWSAPFRDLVLDGLAPEDHAYHQHGISFGPGGTIFAFDNGNNRATPPEPPVGTTSSRAVEYAVDLSAKTAALTWEWAAPGAPFSGSLGNAQWLPERDNVLVVYGNIETADPAEPHVRIYEVTHDDPAEIVFELDVFPAPGSSVTTSRATRWPTLQPTAPARAARR